MGTKRALIDGVAGKQIVLYFNTFEDKEPVEAQFLKAVDANQYQYRITFEPFSVSDWLITYESSVSNKIESAEMFNEVL